MKKFGVEFVDNITEPGPVKILAEEQSGQLAESIVAKIKFSVNKHNSRGVAVSTHYDCVGNPVGKSKQLEQLRISIEYLKSKFPQIQIYGLWVRDNGEVELVFD